MPSRGKPLKETNIEGRASLGHNAINAAQEATAYSIILDRNADIIYGIALLELTM